MVTLESKKGKKSGPAFWSVPAEDTLRQLNSTPDGLTSAEAHSRFERFGPNRLNAKREPSPFWLFLNQFKNPPILLLIGIGGVGNVVGYLGDGINDAPALHAGDVGISVNTAADAANEAADIVLMEKDLGVLIDGAREGCEGVVLPVDEILDQRSSALSSSLESTI